MNKEHLVFLAFIIISTTGLLPWSMFVNAHEYFRYKLRNVTEDTGNMSIVGELTDLQRSYEGWVTIISGLSCLVGSALNFILTDRLSSSFRVISGHILVVLALAPTLAFTFINTDQMQEMFFWLSMSWAALANLGSTGLLGCGLIGFAARFPAVHMQAVMLGQSVSGVLSSILSIVCEAFTSSDVLDGRLFFIIVTLWTISSTMVYIWLVNSPITKLCMDKQVGAANREEVTNLLDDQDVDGQEQDDLNSTSDGLLALRAPQDDSMESHVWKILRETKFEMIAGFLVLFGTLLIFPAVTSLVESTYSTPGLWKKYFSAVACFLLFNVGDAVGRISFRLISVEGYALLVASLLRMLLIPLLFVCNIHYREHSVTLIHWDWVFILLIALLAISNGYLFTSATVFATRKVDDNLRELTGSLIGFMAVLASLAGSIGGAILVLLV